MPGAASRDVKLSGVPARATEADVLSQLSDYGDVRVRMSHRGDGSVECIASFESVELAQAFVEGSVGEFAVCGVAVDLGYSESSRAPPQWRTHRREGAMAVRPRTARSQLLSGLHGPRRRGVEGGGGRRLARAARARPRARAGARPFALARQVARA